ncbi:hypothetical protein GCM10017783_12120 [Deinococcus piscis]|uniref:Uncharacterized protein n=2 Tax=Deinococcus piscis TaxID=394230 RepID=A0ABQ3K332_9DEIO|nr:hypothetical protein GCM10017783_12120 [Deinococcus piscis]
MQSTAVTHRPDGTVLVNGHPFFPFGFYHVSWAWQGTPERRAQDLERLAQAGFNLMITEPVNDRDSANFTALLDQAQQAGMFVIPYGLSAENQQRVLQHPALLGFKVADDVNVNYTPEQAAERSAQFKALNPAKLTYLSLAVGQHRPETPYFAAADLIGNQSYPIGNDDIGVTYRMMRSAVQSAQAQGNVPIANLQSAFWGVAKPTPGEIRNMTYQSLLAGVKGVVYYAYRAPEVDLNAEPFVWKSLQSLSKEVSLLAPLLLDGELISLDTAPQGPLTAYLRGQTPGGEWQGYVVAINTSRKDTQTLDLELPEAPTLWQPIGGPESATLRQDGSSVHGQLAPLQVAVVRVR